MNYACKIYQKQSIRERPPKVLLYAAALRPALAEDTVLVGKHEPTHPDLLFPSQLLLRLRLRERDLLLL